jgi:hypothetical protein
MQGLDCMKLVDWVDMKSKGLVMPTFQLDQAVLLPEVYIPESRRNSLLTINYAIFAIQKNIKHTENCCKAEN